MISPTRASGIRPSMTLKCASISHALSAVDGHRGETSRRNSGILLPQAARAARQRAAAKPCTTAAAPPAPKRPIRARRPACQKTRAAPPRTRAPGASAQILLERPLPRATRPIEPLPQPGVRDPVRGRRLDLHSNELRPAVLERAGLADRAEAAGSCLEDRLRVNSSRVRHAAAVRASDLAESHAHARQDSIFAVYSPTVLADLDRQSPASPAAPPGPAR